MTPIRHPLSMDPAVAHKLGCKVRTDAAAAPTNWKIRVEKMGQPQRRAKRGAAKRIVAAMKALGRFDNVKLTEHSGGVKLLTVKACIQDKLEAGNVIVFQKHRGPKTRTIYEWVEIPEAKK